MFASTFTTVLFGVTAIPVRVEARIESGLPQFSIIGVKDRDARQCRERVRCGLSSIGCDLPLKRVTVNLAPADLPKSGAGLDLPVALAILGAMGEIPTERLAALCSMAEISLGGQLRQVSGVLAGGIAAGDRNLDEMLVAEGTSPMAAYAPLAVRTATSLSGVHAWLSKNQSAHITTLAEPTELPQSATQIPDMNDVRGQQLAVEAAVIAAAGRHNLLLWGPPGCGKTMIAQRIPGIVPHLTGSRLIETAALADAAGVIARPGEIPFRAPHHTISQTGLVGGGSATMQPGELSLAHQGVLFLDELAEFRPTVLDALRQPLEHGLVTVRRSGWSATFPANVQLICATNLCRCGRTGLPDGDPCTCTPAMVAAYQQRISGAILDRVDIAVSLTAEDTALEQRPQATDSTTLKAKITMAHDRQHKRWADNRFNGQMPWTDATRNHWQVDHDAARVLAQGIDALSLSNRSQQAVIRTARTIADLDDSDQVRKIHMMRALSYSSRTFARSES